MALGAVVIEKTLYRLRIRGPDINSMTPEELKELTSSRVFQELRWGNKRACCRGRYTRNLASVVTKCLIKKGPYN